MGDKAAARIGMRFFLLTVMGLLLLWGATIWAIALIAVI